MKVVELGAGVGLPALAAALAVGDSSDGGGGGGAEQVVFTDMYPELLALMRRNLQHNGLAEGLGRYKVDHMDWSHCR